MLAPRLLHSLLDRGMIVATDHRWQCRDCGGESQSGTLFDELAEVSSESTTNCDRCGSLMKLRLIFDVGLNAGKRTSFVEGCFRPKERQCWNDETANCVEFVPFLVITRYDKAKRAVWLPYWHVVNGGDGRTLKYGQWAPLMDIQLFTDLIGQARTAGLLPPEPSAG
jgi:hypothetical protein